MKYMRFSFVGYACILFILILAGWYAYTSTTVPGMNHGEKIHTSQPTTAHSLYSLTLKPDIRIVKKNSPVQIEFTIQKTGSLLVKHFVLSHGKILHLIIVRDDLEYFQHVYPNYNPNTGVFTTTITFPEDGPYKLFAEFFPTEERVPSVAISDVEAGDISAYKPVSFTGDTILQKDQMPYTIKFFYKPVYSEGKTGVFYSVYLEKSGSPLKTLEPYMGSLGHSILIQPQTFRFIHTYAQETAHSWDMHHQLHDEESMHGQPAQSGPWINFQTEVPEPGLYKIFTEFQEQGRVLVTDFLLNIPSVSY